MGIFVIENTFKIYLFKFNQFNAGYPITSSDAIKKKNAAIKQLYALVFDFVIDVINDSTSSGSFGNYIGLLDIAGFGI